MIKEKETLDSIFEDIWTNKILYIYKDRFLYSHPEKNAAIYTHSVFQSSFFLIDYQLIISYKNFL